MQAPKKKTSVSKRNMRRSHHSLTTVKPTACPNCGANVISHTACTQCGQYRGRQLIEATAD